VGWHYGFYTLTVILMLVLLVSLIVIYRRLAVIRPANPATRWLVHFPFSLYLGWITVATIANVSAWLVSLGWNGSPLTPVWWTVILIAVAASLSLVLSFRHRDAIHAAVLVWALVGILIKQIDSAPIVIASALAVLAILGGLAAALRARPVSAVPAR
jgi:hypothetical protein